VATGMTARNTSVRWIEEGNERQRCKLRRSPHTRSNCKPPRTLGPRRRSPSPDSSNSSITLGAATPLRLCLRRPRSPLPKPSNRRQPQAPQHGVDDGKHLTTLRALLLSRRLLQLTLCVPLVSRSRSNRRSSC
jgi:hypothetical protein